MGRFRHRCGEESRQIAEKYPVVALVGMPNVGKSVLFHRLSGIYSTVSNFPGTTVEFHSGILRVGKQTFQVVDTPGIFSLFGSGEVEQAIREFLLEQNVETVILVSDAKNFDRSLFLLTELAHLSIRALLVLNLWDEAEHRGIHIPADSVAQRLGIPIIPTVAIRGTGISRVIKELPNAKVPEIPPLPNVLDGPVQNLALKFSHFPSRLRKSETLRAIFQNPSLQKSYYSAYQIWIKEVVQGLINRSATLRSSWQDSLLHPVGGYLVLAGVLFAMYEIIGVFGAGSVVNFLENRLFGSWILPFLQKVFNGFLPALFYDFLLGQYGMLSMAIPYSLAVIMPIVVLFYATFAVLEDSGYLPRLAVLLHRFFERIGLSGRAVVPMLLGLGCVTMATLTTRLLETRREKILVTLLLALGIPCSAQLAVVLVLLSGPKALLLWGLIVFLNLLIVGWLSHRLFPREPSHFMIEVPPMRLPSLSNIFWKTRSRTYWYIMEVIPLFILATAVLWVLDKTGILPVIIAFLSPVVEGWMRLPEETATAFLLGFFRRDYGAAGLFALKEQGILLPLDALVSAVTITLFVPCLANFLMIWKERGRFYAVLGTGSIFLYSFLTGGILHRILTLWNLQL